MPGGSVRQHRRPSMEMNALQARSNIGKCVSGANCFRQGIINRCFKFCDRSRDDSPLLAACQSADLFIDRDDSTDIQESDNGLSSFSAEFPWPAALKQLKFGIEEYKIPVAIIEVDAAKHHNFTAGAERPALMNVCPMKPLGVNEARAIGKNGVEDAATLASLNHAALVDTRMDCNVLPRMQRIEPHELCSVLIGLGNMQKQIPTVRIPVRSARWTAGTDSFDVLDLGVEAKHGVATFSRSAALSPADRP
jgi:hypothetical protein